MIERLQKFASQFYWLKPFLLTMAGLSLLTAAVVTLRAESLSDDMWLIPALVLFCWCCVTYSVLNLFVSVPAPVDKNSKLWTRIKISIVRGFFFVLALCTIVLTLGLLFVSYQLIRTWMRSY